MIVNPWRWTETERYGHTTKSNFAGFCPDPVLDWGLSFYLKLPQKKKKSHILFQLPCCGCVCCWSQQFPEEKQEHTGTGRQSDTRRTHGLSPSPDTHTHIITIVVCLFWLLTLSTANGTGHKHTCEKASSGSRRCSQQTPLSMQTALQKTSRGGCCCVYAIIYKTRELHPSLWQL